MTDLEQLLLRIVSDLNVTDQAAVVAFAEFLAQRRPSHLQKQAADKPAKTSIPQPLELERPENERVVAAVKRLSKTYPMLDKGKMLGKTSDLVAQHIVMGRDANEIIDELEVIFRSEYEVLKNASGEK